MAPIHSVPRRPKLPKNVPHIIASRGKCWAVVVRMGVLNPQWSPNPKIHRLAKDCTHRNILNWSTSYQIIMFGWQIECMSHGCCKKGMGEYGIISQKLNEIEASATAPKYQQCALLEHFWERAMHLLHIFAHLLKAFNTITGGLTVTDPNPRWITTTSAVTLKCMSIMSSILLHQSSPTIFYVQTRRKCSIS